MSNIADEEEVECRLCHGTGEIELLNREEAACPECSTSELRERIATLTAQLAEAQKERDSADEHAQALEAKFDGCPHPKNPEASTCGCSYDKPSDVCAVHAPQLRKALAQLAERDATIQRLSAPTDIARMLCIVCGSDMDAIGFDVHPPGCLIFHCSKCSHEALGATREEWRQYLQNTSPRTAAKEQE